MESENLFSVLSQFVRQHALPLILGIVGIILILVGLVPLFGKEPSRQDIVFEQGSEHEASVAGSMNKAEIKVDVAGAVVRPGVYSLSIEARVQEAITASGGFSDKANTEWIAKNLNLAAKLSDATKIYVPFEGEEGSAKQNFVGQGSGIVSEGLGQAGNRGLTNINTASQAQLEALPGIGPVTAQKIISNRPYSSVDDLLTKKVVGQSVFGKIKGEVTTN